MLLEAVVLGIVGHVCHGHSHGGHGGHGHVHSHSPSKSDLFNFQQYMPSSLPILMNRLQLYLNSKVFVWSARYNSLLATTLIQIVPLVIISVIILLGGGNGAARDNNTTGTNIINKGLVPFAFGTLLGDIFLHLIPESNQDVLGVGLFVGIVLFFSLDKLVRIISNNDNPSHSHSHSHSHTHSNIANEKEKEMDHDHDHVNENSKFNISVLLNIITGLIHNITDGIAIASSFYNSKQTGIITMMAILFHEVPHELGDFAILLSNGMSIKMGLYTQLLTTVGAILGTSIGCYINEFNKHNPNHHNNMLSHENHNSLSKGFSLNALMLPITAGGFIYIAMMTVLPELSRQENSVIARGLVIKTSRTRQVYNFAIQLIWIVSGFLIMASMSD